MSNRCVPGPKRYFIKGRKSVCVLGQMVPGDLTEEDDSGAWCPGRELGEVQQPLWAELSMLAVGVSPKLGQRGSGFGHLYVKSVRLISGKIRQKPMEIF